MATYVKGSAVTNATSYELFEKVGETYNSLATDDEINFEVSALPLSEGDHTLVVKAHADGYESSDYSNEVSYSVDAKDATWEVYSSDGLAEVTSENGIPTVTCTTNKALVTMLNTNKNFSFTAPEQSAADGGRMVVIGRYGNNVLAFRPRGASVGTNLQRYDYTTFGGGVLTTDGSAVNTFAKGDTLKVEWEGNTAKLFVNGTLQSSFDCSTYVSSEGWRKCAGWLFTNAPASSFSLADFTVVG